VPELPEVETIVRGLADDLPGARIAAVEVLRPDLIEGEAADEFAKSLRGRRIERVGRRAKNIVLELDDGGRLVINLGMTGRVLSSLTDESLRTHLGVRFGLEDGREVLYHDVRRFGRLTRMSPEAWAEWEGRQGIEPLADELTPAHLYELTRRSRVAIKVWLMDQRNVVGVGNIYASEALFRAKLDPRKPANQLTKKEAARVRDGVQSVLREAIDFRGTTFLDYRDAAGAEGAFYERLRVYDREGKPCTTCGAPVLRIVQGGRSTFYCPACQH
jgi:formamidopyrimidine-DNA glycosylase